MKNLKEYLEESLIEESWEIMCEGRILSAIGRAFSKFWKWMMGDVEENTKKNDGTFVIDYDDTGEAKSTVQKINYQKLSELLVSTNSETDEKSFNEFYKKLMRLDNKEKHIYYVSLINKKPAALYCIEEKKQSKEKIDGKLLFASALASMSKSDARSVLNRGARIIALKYNNFVNNISENLDADNLDWKMDVWFNRDENQQMMFNKIFSDKSQLDTEVQNGFDIKGFVDFIYDDVSPDSEKDYIYQFNSILNYLKQRQ